MRTLIENWNLLGVQKGKIIALTEEGWEEHKQTSPENYVCLYCGQSTLESKWDEIEHGTILYGFSKVPLATHGDFALAVAVDVTGRDANIVSLREIFGDDVLGPLRVFVPLDRLLVGKNDICFSIPIHVSHVQAITNFNPVDFHRPPFELRNGLGAKCGS